MATRQGWFIGLVPARMGCTHVTYDNTMGYTRGLRNIPWGKGVSSVTSFLQEADCAAAPLEVVLRTR